MRTLLVLAVVALLALAGCSASAPGDAPQTTTATTDAPDATTRSDPDGDVLGWEGGYWHDDALAATTGDGLNASERAAVVNRSMARVEHLRGIEFEEPVTVDVVSRETYREAYAGSGQPSDALRTFDDAKFEALFLVGEDRNSIAVQESNRGSNVLGFYSPAEDRIVVVSPSETPTIEETTLGHELMHALQFRNFDADIPSPTRDAANARSGLIEGEARFLDQQYGDRCGAAWNCVEAGSGGGGGGDDLHLGIYVMKYFPYSDGPGFVESFYDDGGWNAVADVYDAPPASSEQVARPEKYRADAPSDPTLRDRSNGDWSRVTVDGRAPYGEVGVGGLTAMLAYPAYETDRHPQRAVLNPAEFLNTDGASVDLTDPFDYTTPPVDGWDGERMWVYERDDGETAYAWRIAWDSAGDAREFAESYRDLLRYWGAEQRGDGVWRIPEGESAFADAFRLTVDGNRVTVVNAPTVSELTAVHARA